MDIKKINNQYGDYMFVNESVSTRNGFKHISTLFKGSYEVSTAEVHYLNRTWEAFRYQTVMCKIINNLIDRRKEILYDNFKLAKGYTKMSEKRREEFKKSIENDPILSEYNKLYYDLNAK